MNFYLILVALGTYLVGLLSGYISRAYQFLFLTIRIPPAKGSKIYHYLNGRKTWKFAFTESFPTDVVGDMPLAESSLIFIGRLPIWLDISEKYLTAGQSGKEELVMVTTLRPFKTQLFELFRAAQVKSTEVRKKIDIYVSCNSWFRHLNSLNREEFANGLYLDKNIETKLDEVLTDFESKKRPKSGILLYGPPGNGKTSIIKAAACKYDCNVYMPLIRANMNNEDVIGLFANIPVNEKAIIVLEDFDNLFHHRHPQLHEAKFSFDVFLNILDGMYINLENKLIFITANDIDRIDRAIKNRPSRVDFCLKIDNPGFTARRAILEKHGKNGASHRIAELTDGQSAAIVAEIAKRSLDENRLEDEVAAVIASFQDDESGKPQARLINPADNLPEAYGRMAWITSQKANI